MSLPLRKILEDQRDLLLFRPFKPAIKNHWLTYLAWGLFVTWLAGIGRYWDHPNANWWQYAGLGSVAYVFVLGTFLWLIVAPLRPRNWSFIGVLIFVTLTSLPALLYAIPVEKFMSLQAAQTANVIFLAIVASWRVALLIVFLRRSAGLMTTAWSSRFCCRSPHRDSAARSIRRRRIRIRAQHATDAEHAAYFILLIITVLSVVLSPIMLILYCVLVYQARRQCRSRARNRSSHALQMQSARRPDRAAGRRNRADHALGLCGRRRDRMAHPWLAIFRRDADRRDHED